jgi:hypothetical protein
MKKGGDSHLIYIPKKLTLNIRGWGGRPLIKTTRACLMMK